MKFSAVVLPILYETQCSCVAFLVTWMRLHVGHQHAEHEEPISTNARLIISHLVAVKLSACHQLFVPKWGSRCGSLLRERNKRGTSETSSCLGAMQWEECSVATCRSACKFEVCGALANGARQQRIAVVVGSSFSPETGFL